MSGSRWLAGSGVALAICLAVYTSPGAVNRFDIWLHDGLPSSVHIFAAGCISGFVLVPILISLLKMALGHLFRSREKGDYELYRLDHGRLNVEVPPASMWMNMGYWKHTKDFPAACRALLDEVMKTAGLLGQDGLPLSHARDTRSIIIDLGFGCGDQSICLAQLSNNGTQEQPGNSASEDYLFDRYIGLTIASHQCSLAQERLDSCATVDSARVKLFCADAAKPASWSKDIREAITDASTEKCRTSSGSTTPKHATWVLALDTLYHFKPSREAIFCHASGELNASIIAFDLLLSDTPSFWNLIFLRIISLFAEMPFSNFVTIAQYKSQLRAAGYDEDRVEIRDISEYVFPGISSFIKRRDIELKGIGMTIGRYSIAGKMFGWWARSGIIRGCIVVAKR